VIQAVMEGFGIDGLWLKRVKEKMLKPHLNTVRPSGINIQLSVFSHSQFCALSAKTETGTHH